MRAADDVDVIYARIQEIRAEKSLSLDFKCFFRDEKYIKLLLISEKAKAKWSWQLRGNRLLEGSILNKDNFIKVITKEGFKFLEVSSEEELTP